MTLLIMVPQHVQYSLRPLRFIHIMPLRVLYYHTFEGLIRSEGDT